MKYITIFQSNIATISQAVGEYSSISIRITFYVLINILKMH